VDYKYAVGKDGFNGKDIGMIRYFKKQKYCDSLIKPNVKYINEILDSVITVIGEYYRNKFPSKCKYNLHIYDEEGYSESNIYDDDDDAEFTYYGEDDWGDPVDDDDDDDDDDDGR
jgi:hypothetical protein